MIDISTEQPITFAEAAKLSLRRRDGRGTHVATVHRWAAVGCRGIKLEFLQMGGIEKHQTRQLTGGCRRNDLAAKPSLG